MRIVRVPSGIGDNIWLLQKLVNTGEKFHFILPASEPLRGKQIFDLMPSVTATCKYMKGMTYRKLEKGNIQKIIPYWKSIVGRKIPDMMLSCNEWLENGNRIETFLPDLETSFRLDYVTSQEDKDFADQLITFQDSCIGIYASAYSTQRAWGFWTENEWFDLIKRIYTKYPHYKFVIIGALWDTDLGRNLIDLLHGEGIPYINTIGLPLGGTIEVLKRLDYFIGFPSGLSILNETLGKKGLMFYPPHLEKMIDTWAHPDRIKNEDYKGMLFCDVDTVYKWIIKSKIL